MTYMVYYSWASANSTDGWVLYPGYEIQTGNFCV